MILKASNIDKTWTLFLDRDGVINKKLENDYVKSWKEFEFLPNVIEALKILRSIFGKLIIVTNQRCIGRGIITEKDLENIHFNMLNVLEKHGIKIDKIYHCPHDYEKEMCECRKPNPGMLYKAKIDFPEIDFTKSIVVGDSFSDLDLGINANIMPVLLSNCTQNIIIYKNLQIYCFKSLYDYANFILQSISNKAFLQFSLKN